MSFGRSSRRVATGKVAFQNGVPLPLLQDPKTNLQWDEVKPLSGKPYSLNVLSPSNLHPRYSMVPGINLRLVLPSYEVPTILTYQGKSWDLVYYGQSKHKTLNAMSWKKFAVDSCLRVGDACIFELMENSDMIVILEVQILRGDIPYEFLGNEIQENEMAIGQGPEMPIVLN